MNDGPVVGVVGTDASPVVTAVEAAGGTPDRGAASDVVDGSDFVVAIGESALLAVARAAPAVPVLPVAAGRGVRSVPRSEASAAVASLLSGEFECECHPVADVTVADRLTALALLDVMLVSAQPAQISEYAVRSGGELVARFRADGVVVATPGGSGGYARAAGGPVVPPETDAVVVVPVGPFATDVDHWVLPPEGLRVSVERDETDVHLLADDRVVGPVTEADPVEVSPGAAVEIAVVAESQSCFRHP